MNKQELITLKKKLESRFYIVTSYEIDGPITFEDIEKKANTEDAVNYIENYFESLMNYFSEKRSDYDELTLVLSFALIVIEDNMNNFYQIKEGKKPLDDFVRVFVCSSYGKDSNRKEKKDSSFVLEDGFQEFIVSFSKYIYLLKERGFEIDGINNFKEISNLILLDQPAVTKVSIKFDKRKIKEKVLK